MTKNASIVIAVSILVAVGGIYYYGHKSDGLVACSQEAKICPDGTAVVRVGPNCEFAACPGTVAKGSVEGKVTVGPICPVERPGVPCPVPSEAYTSREVILYAADGTTEVQRMHFLPDGTYHFDVPAGTYVLDTPHGGIGIGSSELPKTLTVGEAEKLEVNFSIDTGIR